MNVNFVLNDLMVVLQAASELQQTDREAGVACPQCQLELTIGNFGQLKVATCRTCKGLLFPAEALAAFVADQRSSYTGSDVAPQPMDWRQLEQRRNCPSCIQQFQTHSYSGPGNVVIDFCRECNLIWLDGGELTGIIQAPGRR